MEDNAEHAIQLVKTLYDFSKKKKYTDFTITVGNAKVSCHKPVICAQSAFFDSICSGGASEVSLDRFDSPKEDELVLTKTIRFIYLGTIDLTKDIVLAVLKAAEYIKNQHLKIACENFLITLLDVSNWQVYAENAQHFELTALTEACDHLCRSKFSWLIKTESFLPSLSVSELVSYLEDDDLTVSSEDEILHCVHVWITKCKASEEKKEEYLEILFPHIRLSFCDSLKSFAKEKDVSKSLKLKIYEYLHDEDKREFTPRVCYQGSRARATKGTTVITKPKVMVSAPPQSSTASTSTTGSTTHTTKPKVKVPTSLASAASTGTTESKIVIVGGRGKRNIYSSSIMYLEKQDNPEITQGELCKSCHYSVCTNEERLVISGGYDTDTSKSVSSVQQYSMKTHQWSDLPNLLNPRCKHASTCIDERLYILAGCNEENDEAKQYYTEVHVLDLKTLHWSKVMDMPLEVMDPGLAVVNKQILVTGGADSEGKWFTKTLKYQTLTDKWMRCKDLPVFCEFAVNSTVAHGNKVYVLAHENFLMYDVSKDEWCKLACPLRPSYWCAMVLWKDTMLAIGGYEETGKPQNPHDRLQSYNLHSQKWSLLAETMPFPLSVHSAFVMQPPKSQ